MRGRTVKSPELVAEAQRLRGEGLVYREIGERLGVPLKSVYQWINDPDGAALRARKDSYAGICVDCGEPTSGSEGRREEPRCHPCAVALANDERTIWTSAALVCAIQEWAHEYGEPPGVIDWSPYDARTRLHDEARARRFEDADGQWPWFTHVVRVFGSWNAGIDAAGFTPREAHGGGGNVQRRRSARAKAAS